MIIFSNLKNLLFDDPKYNINALPAISPIKNNRIITVSIPDYAKQTEFSSFKPAMDSSYNSFENAFTYISSFLKYSPFINRLISNILYIFFD
jgi:hypothetical protein